MAILQTRGLSIKFGGVEALRRLDLEVEEGEIFGLIGPNGAGKTTCLNVVTGFLMPTAGTVMYKGQPITALEPNAIAKRGLVRTFQITNVFPNLTAEENVIIGRYLRTSGNALGAFFRSRSYRFQEAILKKKAVEILDLLGFQGKRNVIARNLPHGEERKLEIAIALACEPKLLLLDEPAAGMNPDECSRLVNLIQLIQGTGITVLIVEHNMKVVMEVCTKVAVLDFGIKIAEGTPDVIAHDEKVIAVYLGRENGNIES